MTTGDGDQTGWLSLCCCCLALHCMSITWLALCTTAHQLARWHHSRPLLDTTELAAIKYDARSRLYDPLATPQQTYPKGYHRLLSIFVLLHSEAQPISLSNKFSLSKRSLGASSPAIAIEQQIEPRNDAIRSVLSPTLTDDLIFFFEKKTAKIPKIFTKFDFHAVVLEHSTVLIPHHSCASQRITVYSVSPCVRGCLFPVCGSDTGVR